MIRTRKFWINAVIGLLFFLSLSVGIDAFLGNTDWSWRYFAKRLFIALVWALAFGYLLTRRRPSSTDQ
jgi:hypothetical protein